MDVDDGLQSAGSLRRQYKKIYGREWGNSGGYGPSSRDGAEERHHESECILVPETGDYSGRSAQLTHDRIAANVIDELR